MDNGYRVVTSLSHLEILRRGPQAWNEWRAQNPDVRPHLSNVALSLSERQWGPMHGGPINFKSAILPDASLRFASLLDADLQAADLTRAALRSCAREYRFYRIAGEVIARISRSADASRAGSCANAIGPAIPRRNLRGLV